MIITTSYEAADIAFQRNGGRPFRSYRARANAVRRVLRGLSYETIDATFDDAGNCTVCGEAGRCPGVHTLDEVKNKREGIVT